MEYEPKERGGINLEEIRYYYMWRLNHEFPKFMFLKPSFEQQKVVLKP